MREYLDGVTLTELVVHSGPVPPGRVIHILRQVGAALREAHQHGMIHRDVKPEDVMLCRRGEDDVVKLLDFGLVKNLERTQTRDITKQLKILGTPRYMAPERILNPADVDARSDIYALGAVAYYLLTGKPIFEGDNNLEISNQVLHAAAPRASASGIPGIPDGLDELIAACLEKGPGTATAVRRCGDRGARPPVEPPRVDECGRAGLVGPLPRDPRDRAAGERGPTGMTPATIGRHALA